MINKLKKKVFLILMLSISIVLIGAITLFAYVNYTSSISAATSIMERVNDFGKIQDNMQPPEIGSMTENKLEKEEMPPRENINLSTDLEDTYYYIIEDEKIINESGEQSSILEEYALKVSKNKKESGILGNYIYKKAKGRNDSQIVMLMKNESVITRIRVIVIASGIACGLVLISAYFISKKVSNWIVKPVEETIAKQKQFISDASHELKTPLAVIEANVDVLEGQVGKSKWMEYIQSEITSMDKLINNLLFLAKIENTKHIKNNEDFNISEELSLTASMFESMAYEKQIRINYNITDNIKMKGYKEDIKQVVSILIDNAIKHTNNSGNIYIELNKEKNSVIIQIKNEGESIPEDEKDKIFERFYRVDKSRNRKEKRYGLGLAIAKSIIDQYNGKIEVICKEGITNFRVTI